MSARRTLLALVAAAALLSSGCGGDEPEGAGPASPGSPRTSVSAAGPPTATRPPYEVLDGPFAHCGPLPTTVREAGFRSFALRDPAVGRIPAVRAGAGRTAVVLLHQTNANGLCGWLPFATTLVDRPGLQVLAIDLCKYGESRCTKVEDDTFTPADQTDAVELAIDHARGPMKARRVVVVGASMGGSVAMMAASRLDGIDTAVDLSGPVEWNGMETVRRGRALQVPVLVAMAEAEGEDEMDGARRIVENAPAGSELIEIDAGHGYELLLDRDDQPTEIAERVVRWIEGRPDPER